MAALCLFKSSTSDPAWESLSEPVLLCPLRLLANATSLSSSGTFVLERDGAGLAAAASSPLSASTDRAGVDGRVSEPDGAAGRLFQNGAAPGSAMPGGVGRYSADAEGSSGTDGSGDDFV